MQKISTNFTRLSQGVFLISKSLKFKVVRVTQKEHMSHVPWKTGLVIAPITFWENDISNTSMNGLTIFTSLPHHCNRIAKVTPRRHPDGINNRRQYPKMEHYGECNQHRIGACWRITSAISTNLWYAFTGGVCYFWGPKSCCSALTVQFQEQNALF